MSFICLIKTTPSQTVAISLMTGKLVIKKKTKNKQTNSEAIFSLTFPRLGLHRYLRLKTHRANTRKTKARARATLW